MSVQQILTQKVEATVRGVEFAGELNRGGYRRGVFYPEMVWASMAPKLTPELRKKITSAVDECLARGYSIGDRPVDEWMEDFVEDFQSEDGRSNTRFHGGCKGCEGQELLSKPAWMLEEFRDALGVAKYADFSLIVSTTIFLGQRWTSGWKYIAEEHSERDYEGEQFCVFHGVSKYKDAEVLD